MAPSTQDTMTKAADNDDEAATIGTGTTIPTADEKQQSPGSSETPHGISIDSTQGAMASQHTTLEEEAEVDEQANNESETQDNNDEPGNEDDEYEPVDQPPPLRYVSILTLDHLTVENVLDVFYSGQQWWDENALPIKRQLAWWWNIIQNFMESEVASIPIDQLYFTHTMRHFLWQMNFVALPEEIYASHMQWHALLPFIEDARREIPRTRGYLALLTREFHQYESAWMYFWDLIEGGVDNQYELTRVLENLFTAMKRFYFLMNSMNACFHYTFRGYSSMFQGHRPVWYVWDCETWRQEQWEFSERKLEEMLEDLEVKDGQDENPGEREQNEEEDDDEEDLEMESHEDDQNFLELYLNDDAEVEIEMVFEEEPRQLLTERDWLRQQMGLY